MNWIFYVHHDRYYGFVVAILGLYVIGHYSGFAEAERLILLCDRRKSSYIIVPRRAIDPADIASRSAAPQAETVGLMSAIHNLRFQATANSTTGKPSLRNEKYEG